METGKQDGYREKVVNMMIQESLELKGRSVKALGVLKLWMISVSGCTAEWFMAYPAKTVRGKSLPQ